MEREPKRLIQKLFEYCAIFALSTFLIRLGIAYLEEVWVVLLIAVIVIGLAVVLYRIYKNKIM